MNLKVLLYILVAIALLLTVYLYYDTGNSEIMCLGILFFVVAQAIYNPANYKPHIVNLLVTFTIIIGIMGVLFYFLNIPTFSDNMTLLLSLDTLLLGVLLYVFRK